MALTVGRVSNPTLTGVAKPSGGARITSVGVANGGMQGATYSPQGATYNPQNAGRVSSVPAGTTYSAPRVAGVATSAVDPAVAAARAAEESRLNNVRREVGQSQAAIRSGGRVSATDNTNTYRTNNQSFVNGIRTGQNTINSDVTNNALNTRRSMAGIASDVRTGIQSGKIALSAMGAGNSSAADAMAKAWATVGNRNAASVRNQAQITANELGTQQQNLDLQETQGWQNLQNWRSTETNRISQKLYNDLAALDVKAQTQGVMGAVDMAYRDQLIAEATAELNDIDNQTRADLAAIGGLTPEQAEMAAARMDELGAAVQNPFAVDTIETSLPDQALGQEQVVVRRPEDEVVQV